MSFLQPSLLILAVIVVAALTAAAVGVERRRTAAYASSGLTAPRGIRRHAATILLIAGVAALLVSLARPQATIVTPRAAGTVILAFDVSASMTADDVDPTRLAAAQEAAVAFVADQPDSVDIGVVAFADGALTTQLPSEDHAEALAAIDRLTATGGTSVGQAILTALSAITGQTVTLAEDGTEQQDLGYWGSATIIVFSDGEEAAESDAVAAAAVAANAGVHVETIGVGTSAGATIDVDGYTVTTVLDEALLTEVAETTGGTYHALADAAEVTNIADSIELRVSPFEEEIEVTSLVAAGALVVLIAAGVLMILRTGRFV